MLVALLGTNLVSQPLRKRYQGLAGQPGNPDEALPAAVTARSAIGDRSPIRLRRKRALHAAIADVRWRLLGDE